MRLSSTPKSQHRVKEHKVSFGGNPFDCSWDETHVSFAAEIDGRTYTLNMTKSELLHLSEQLAEVWASIQS